jgi:hypothetical protein
VENQKLPRPKKACMSKSKVKTILIVFFDSKGILLQKYVPPGQTINQHYYITLLEHLRERIWKRKTTDVAQFMAVAT